MFRDESNIFRIRHGNGNHSRKDTEHQKYHVIGSNGTDQVAERKQRDSQFSTQVLRNVSLFLEQEEKMDKLINSEMPAYVNLEGENFRRVLEAMDMAGNLVNGSPPGMQDIMHSVSLHFFWRITFSLTIKKTPGTRYRPGYQNFS